jgi:hypothetical protein
MIVRYNRPLAIILLIIGLLAAAALLLQLMLGGLNPLNLGSLLTLFVAYMMLTQPYFTVEDSQIVIHALIGATKRTYHYNSDADVKMEGNSLFVRKDALWQRTMVARWLVNGDDWAALEARFKRP